jgi:PPOX class probable F420-dependent enzyme
MNDAAFSTLVGHQYMNLTTFRRDGRAVVTPVWFADIGGALVVMTGAEAGKVKRIRANSHVLLAPSDRAGKPLGAEFTARARVLSPSEQASADAALTRKYGMMKRMFDLMGRLRGAGSRAYLAIEPA